MTKQQFFEQLNLGLCLTPSNADEVTWFYEWFNAPVKSILPARAQRNEPRKLSARAMTTRIREFLQHNQARGKTSFNLTYRDNQITILGIFSSLTVKL